MTPTGMAVVVPLPTTIERDLLCMLGPDMAWYMLWWADQHNCMSSKGYSCAFSMSQSNVVVPSTGSTAGYLSHLLGPAPTHRLDGYLVCGH